MASECIVKLRENKYVILYVAAGSKELKIPVGIQTNSKHFENGKFKHTYGKNYKELNEWLQGEKNRINILIREAFHANTNAVEYVKDVLNKEKVKNNQVIIKGNQPICEAFKIYIDSKYEKDINKISKRSFDRYFNEYKRLCEFDSKTTLSQIDMIWINKLMQWLAKEKTVKLHVVDTIQEREFNQTKTISMGNATIKRFCDDLMTFFKTLQETIKLEYPHKFLDDLHSFRDSLTTNSDEGRNIVAMSEDELNAFRAIRTTLKHKWQIDTWNAYMVGCLSGLRFSDIRLLDTSYINQNNEIVMNLQKTEYWVTIPVRTELMNILNYYGGSMVDKVPTIQRLNINLRKILKTIPMFQRPDKEYKFVLKKKTPIDLKRWERFTFHTSRKTFITLCIRKSATYDQLKALTGIHDYRTINHYMEFQNNGNNYSNILTF